MNHLVAQCPCPPPVSNVVFNCERAYRSGGALSSVETLSATEIVCPAVTRELSSESGGEECEAVRSRCIKTEDVVDSEPAPSQTDSGEYPAQYQKRSLEELEEVNLSGWIKPEDVVDYDSVTKLVTMILSLTLVIIRFMNISPHISQHIT